MFDLITGKASHIPRRQTVPMVLSVAAEVMAVSVIATASLLVAVERVPVRTMMAFVAALPAPAPPPPAPPPPAARTTQPVARPVPTTGAFAAPVEAPPRVEPEAQYDFGEEGVPGGVEGGLPGGVLGGIVGGLPDEPPAPPPPPPPPPPMPKGPVRVGGEIKAPTLLHRVEPVYPPFALAAQVEGTVILEAIVDEQGVVQEVRAIRSQPLLEKAAIEAVRQWRYSPVLLNGRPVPFILTVVLSFNVQKK